MTSKTQKKVSFHTLGCKLNFAETSTIVRMFTENGYKKVEFDEPTDVVVINTCSVTQLADKKCRQSIHKANRTSPDAIIAIIGCYSQLKPEEIAQMDGVDLVLGTKDKFNILDFIKEIETKKNNKPLISSCDIGNVENFSSSFSLLDRTRSFLKIQDGCDYHCSYCTIPLARGNSRNSSIAHSVEDAHKIAATGIKEIVLTGVNIGDFGKSTGETFFELIQQLDMVEGIERYRISSIEPNLLTDEIIRFVSSSRSFMPHFHIPLQSGSNEILKLMSRRYKREVFENRIKTIKSIMPDACIGADIIVGFPGETDELFLDTYHFLKNQEISYLHVFAYSERRNTKAVLMPGKVFPKEKDQRSKMLIELSDSKKKSFYLQHQDKSFHVLFESAQTKGKMFGFTTNYIKIETEYNREFINKVMKIKLSQIVPSGNMSIIIPHN
jgi:threonylcarbamoyladenosine tRNA methylthiotransferase MtaB